MPLPNQEQDGHCQSWQVFRAIISKFKFEQTIIFILPNKKRFLDESCLLFLAKMIWFIVLLEVKAYYIASFIACCRWLTDKKIKFASRDA